MLCATVVRMGETNGANLAIATRPRESVGSMIDCQLIARLTAGNLISVRIAPMATTIANPEGATLTKNLFGHCWVTNNAMRKIILERAVMRTVIARAVTATGGIMNALAPSKNTILFLFDIAQVNSQVNRMIMDKSFSESDEEEVKDTLRRHRLL